MEALTIRNDNGVLQPMRFLESQERIWDKIAPVLDSRGRVRLVILKARQICASTLTQALMFIRTLEKPGTQSLVVAQDLFSADYIFNMAKRFYEHLPLPHYNLPKAKEIRIPFIGGDSFLRVVSAGVSSKTRGANFSCIHASETAFWPHPEIWTGLAQTLPEVDDTVCILESTAQGKTGNGELFYQAWQLAISGESDYIPVFIPWFTMSKYRASYINHNSLNPKEFDEEEKILNETFGVDADQLAWRRWAIKNRSNGSVEQFHQEFPSTPEEAFISSGLPAFDRLALMKQHAYISNPIARGTCIALGVSEVKFTNDPQGELRVWKMPEAGHQYVIGADTAEGLEGGDYTCAEVLDMGTLEQVASIHGTIAPWEFSLLLNAVGRWYNKALLAIEVNNHGYAVQDYMIRTHLYPNLHPWKGKPDQIHRGRARLWGWETNSYSRPLLIEAGRRVINGNLITIHEQKLLDELNDFSRNDQGRYEADGGNDDRVLAMLVALRSREENYYPARSKPAYTEEFEVSNMPVRVVEGRDESAAAKRHVSKVLKGNARKAVQNWMQM